MHRKPSCETLARTHQQELTQTVGDFLQHVHTTEIQPDAATVFVYDECNPDSIGAIATACSPQAPTDGRFDFQKAHITGHRVDGSSVAGRVIEGNQDDITLTESAMNPDHRVLNLPLPDQHAVLQAAFTKDRTPTKHQLDELETLWQYDRKNCARRWHYGAASISARVIPNSVSCRHVSPQITHHAKRNPHHVGCVGLNRGDGA